MTAVTGKILLKAVLRAVVKLEHAVFGNGKEGLQIVVDRIDNRMDASEQHQKIVEEKIDAIQLGIQDIRRGMLDSRTVRAITKEEIQKYKKETLEEPGSWMEFRKTWLFPTMMMVISALISAGLTYIVVAGPK